MGSSWSADTNLCRRAGVGGDTSAESELYIPLRHQLPSLGPTGRILGKLHNRVDV